MKFKIQVKRDYWFQVKLEAKNEKEAREKAKYLETDEMMDNGNYLDAFDQYALNVEQADTLAI